MKKGFLPNHALLIKSVPDRTSMRLDKIFKGGGGLQRSIP